MTLKKRTIFLWALYDFANSVYPAVITATVFGVYFTRQIVGNETGLGDLWWGRVISVSMLFVALTSPPLGAIADRAGIRKKMLFLYTYLCVLCVTLFTTIQPGMILWAFTLAVLANIGFEGALVYYNSYLPNIAPPERQGSVSGIGFGFGYAGSAIGLFLALPLVVRERFDITWLTVAAFFTVFSLPTFFGLPPDRRGDQTICQAAIEGFIGFKRLATDVLKLRDLRRFLLAFFIYIDGVNTTIYFSAIFASTTLGFANSELIYLFLVVQVSALVGAFVMARPTDLWGPRRIISGTLVLWTAVALIAYFVESKILFFTVAVLAGVGLGVVQAASRALMSKLIPKGKEAEMFGFYAFCGKSSSIIGPLVFGGISHALGGNQRAAIFSVIAFFFVGFVLLLRVRDPLPETTYVPSEGKGCPRREKSQSCF